MIEAELFDGTVLEFPDGTAPFVIEATVKRQTAERKQAKLDTYKVRDPAEYDPQSPEFQAKYGATAVNNFFQNANAGIGKTFTDLWLGGKQMVGMASPEDAAEKKRMDAALMDTAGGKVGYGAGMIAAGVPIAMATGGATVPAAAFTAGLLGAFQPAESVGERYLNTGRDAATAALFGYGANQWVGRAGSYLTPFGRAQVPQNFVAPTPEVRASYQPTSPLAQSQAGGMGAAQASGQSGAGASVSINPQARFRQESGFTFGTVGDDPSAGLTSTQQRIAANGREMGMRLTPGQASGSKALQRFEAKLESQPMTSGPFDAIRANNQKILNEQWARAVGEKSDVVDGRVLQSASDRLGGIFESYRNPDIKVMADRNVTKTVLDGLDDEVSGLLPNNATFRDQSLVKTIEEAINAGVVDGKQLGGWSSKLGKAAMKQMTTDGGDRDLGIALFRLKDHVDDMLESALPEADRAIYSQARGQWRNLISLTSRVGNVNPSTGNVSARNMAGTLMSKDKKGYTFGQNQSDWYNATRFGQAFAPLVGDSGTATRSPLQGSTAEFLLSIPANIATRAYTSNTASALAGGMARAGAAAQPFTQPIGAAAQQATNYGGLLFPYAYPGLISGYYGQQ